MGMAGCFAAADKKTLAALRNDPSQIEEFLFPNDGDDVPENYADVDKAWHGIHYMLTGSAVEGEGSLALAVLGGEEVGDDVGYGAARFLTPEQVKAVSAALQELGPESFASRFNAQAMEDADIYPKIWVRDGADALDYVLENYREMVAFYLAAAERGDGAILWLC